MVVTRDTTIGEVLAEDMGAARYFFEIGMHCVGCPSSSGESIAEACVVHGVNEDDLVNRLETNTPSRSKQTWMQQAG